MWKFEKLAYAAPARYSLWGDGLVDQSLPTLWYANNWQCVDIDELTFFIPALSSHSALSTLTDYGSGGPVGHIRNALGRRLVSAVRVLARALGPETVGQEARALEAIDKIAILSIPADVLLGGADKPHPRAVIFRWSSSRSLREAAIYELSVLTCLDRMMQDAGALLRAEAPPTASDSRVSAADAVVASMYCGVNGAYVYRDLAYMHETLATGAWLGTVLSGRAALLPQFVAEVLCELFERLLQHGEESLDDVDRVLLEHTRIAVGQHRLRRAALRVARLGTPKVVRAKRLELQPWSHIPIWNRQLNGRISQALDRLMNSC